MTMRFITIDEAISFQDACSKLLVAGKIEYLYSAICFTLLNHYKQTYSYEIIDSLINTCRYIDEKFGDNGELGPIRQTFLMFIITMSPEDLIDMVGDIEHD